MSTLDDLLHTADRLRRVRDAALRRRWRVGALLGAGGFGAVFALDGASEEEHATVAAEGLDPDATDLDGWILDGSAIKIPVAWPQAEANHTVVAHGAGPHRIVQITETGPFVTRGIDGIQQAEAILRASAAQQARHSSPVLPEVRLVAELGGVPVAIYERLDAVPLPHLIANYPDTARAALPAIAASLQVLHSTFGHHGDLKPEHVLWDPASESARFIDPLRGADEDAWIGTWGYTLGPVLAPDGTRAGILEDLGALVAIAAATLGHPALWGRWCHQTINAHNGRFGRGLAFDAIEQAVHGVFAAPPIIPGPWLDAASAYLDAFRNRSLASAPQSDRAQQLIAALATPR